MLVYVDGLVVWEEHPARLWLPAVQRQVTEKPTFQAPTNSFRIVRHSTMSKIPYNVALHLATSEEQFLGLPFALSFVDPKGG
jgi:hypothetical protein